MIASAKLPAFGASLAMIAVTMSPALAESRAAKRATASQESTDAAAKRGADQERSKDAVVPAKPSADASPVAPSLAALFGAAPSGAKTDQSELRARRLKAGIIANGETRAAAARSAAAETSSAKPAVVALAKAEAVPAAAQAVADATDAGAIPAGSVRALIAQHAARNGIPPALADAVVRVESRYNAAARNGVNLGLTQISLSTARSLGYSGAAGGLLNADTNLQYGMLYLAQAYRLSGGDTCRTILKYQAGHRATSMTGAARAYCAKVKTTVAAAN
ncbi:transglycosylase SLT domain-containing protein [Alsobacter sp. KACC 23698]|uniref:Transglycosylase SLT domain-containing protein n=1 Tax=Alsobacter sp. KACC 23698 TaxID=3149229 RepID=A0AAU7JAY1_9HYPH